MSKKKKIGITIGIIVLVIAGFIGRYQYTKYQAEEHLKLAEMRSVFLVVRPEDKNLLKSTYTDADLKAFIKNPPKIEMDTGSGLGLKVSAFNYYHDEDIDPYLIQEMMETGKFHEAYEYTVDFVHWSSNYPNQLEAYKDALKYAAEKIGTPLPAPKNTTYQDYLDIINNRNTPALIEEYYASKRKLTDE